VGEDDVDRAAVAAGAPPRGPHHRPRAPGLLALRPLVGPVPVAHAAAEAHEPQARDVDDPAVGVVEARRARPRLGQPVAEPEAAPLAEPGEVRVVVARHQHAGAAQAVGDVGQVVERQVARGDDEVDALGPGPAAQAGVLLVAHDQRVHHEAPAYGRQDGECARMPA
jgi:hypothetical protein